MCIAWLPLVFSLCYKYLSVGLGNENGEKKKKKTQKGSMMSLTGKPIFSTLHLFLIWSNCWCTSPAWCWEFLVIKLVYKKNPNTQFMYLFAMINSKTYSDWLYYSLFIHCLLMCRVIGFNNIAADVHIISSHAVPFGFQFQLQRIASGRSTYSLNFFL